MATLPLVPTQIETSIQRITIDMLGLPAPQFEDDPAYKTVRIGWQQQGQPAWQITEDVVFVRCVEEDDWYNRVRDVEYISQPDPEEIITYTRVWRVFWSVYGPNSFDNARKLRSSLFSQAIHDEFSGNNLYLVTDPSAPVRAPELNSGQWWDRVDFSARFNEAVEEVSAASFVTSSEVILENSREVLADIIVTPPVPVAPLPAPPLPPPPPQPVPTADVTLNGGTISELAGQILEANSIVTAVDYSGGVFVGNTITGNLGTAKFSNLHLISGDFQNGGVLAAGGLIHIETPNFPLNYDGVLDSATWIKLDLAGGTHAYFFAGTFSSGQGSGAFAFTTNNIGTGVWAGSATIHDVQIHYN